MIWQTKPAYKQASCVNFLIIIIICRCCLSSRCLKPSKAYCILTMYRCKHSPQALQLYIPAILINAQFYCLWFHPWFLHQFHSIKFNTATRDSTRYLCFIFHIEVVHKTISNGNATYFSKKHSKFNSFNFYN